MCGKAIGEDGGFSIRKYEEACGSSLFLPKGIFRNDFS
jgi:hypothetical protein